MTITIIPREQPELMADLRMISLGSALLMEVKFGMQLRRGVYGLKIAQSMGFKGNRKVDALHWVIAQLRDRGVDVPRTLVEWEAENPA